MGGMTLVDPGSVNLGLASGELSNPDLLRALVDLVERLGRPSATIRDTRRILGIDQPSGPRPR
jgi:hypothetical protein